MFLGRLAIAIFLGLSGGVWVFTSGNGILAAILAYCGIGSTSMLALSLAAATRQGDSADATGRAAKSPI